MGEILPSLPQDQDERLRVEAGDVSRRFKPYEYTDPPFDINQEVVRHLNLKGHETIADIGSYEGGFPLFLRVSEGHYGRIYGVDPIYSPQVVAADFPTGIPQLVIRREDIPEHELRRLRTKFLKASIEDLPFPDKSIDVFTLFMMMYMVPEAEQVPSLEALKSKLKDDGRLVLTTSAVFNKAFHRQFEKQMAGDVRQPPLRMNRTFNSERAADVLSGLFANVYHYSYRGRMMFRDEVEAVVYLESLLTMYDRFDPPFSTERIAKSVITERVAPKVFGQIAALGYFADIAARDFFICSDSPSGLRVYERGGRRLVHGYYKAKPDPQSSYSSSVGYADRTTGYNGI